jgi:anti-anti-sigma factor
LESFQVLNPAPRTFELHGDLDMATAPSLLVAVAPALVDPGDLIFDLANLSFMDSSGIRAMVRIAGSLSGSLLLIGPQPIVKRVLEISAVDGHGNIRLLADPSVLAEDGWVGTDP